MSGQRSIPARAGIVALNLLAPGLGPLRVGRLKAAAFFLAVTPGAMILVILAYAFAPTFDFTAYATAMILALAVGFGAFVGSATISWRGSREAADARPRWSRWYAIAGAFLAWLAIVNLLINVARNFYSPFYLPSEAMAPTLLRKDRIIARIERPATLRRGDIILLQMADDITYVKRLAGLPGDTIEMVGGLVYLNGQPVTQRLEGVERVDGYGGAYQARRLTERFPGEASPHSIYDTGPSAIDDFPLTRVRPGHVFVLGDNRDQSADSRSPVTQWGVGQHPIDRIKGRPLFHSLFSSKSPGHRLTP